MSNRSVALSIILLLLFSFSAKIHADTVTLKNGQVLQGKITSQSAKQIQILTERGQRTVNKTDIARITYGDTDVEKLKKEKEKRDLETQKIQLEKQKADEEKRRLDDEKRKEEEKERSEREKQDSREREKNPVRSIGDRRKVSFGYGVLTNTNDESFNEANSQSQLQLRSLFPFAPESGELAYDQPWGLRNKSNRVLRLSMDYGRILFEGETIQFDSRISNPHLELVNFSFQDSSVEPYPSLFQIQKLDHKRREYNTLFGYAVVLEDLYEVDAVVGQRSYLEKSNLLGAGLILPQDTTVFSMDLSHDFSTRSQNNFIGLRTTGRLLTFEAFVEFTIHKGMASTRSSRDFYQTNIMFSAIQSTYQFGGADLTGNRFRYGLKFGLYNFKFYVIATDQEFKMAHTSYDQFGYLVNPANMNETFVHKIPGDYVEQYLVIREILANQLSLKNNFKSIELGLEANVDLW